MKTKVVSVCDESRSVTVKKLGAMSFARCLSFITKMLNDDKVQKAIKDLQDDNENLASISMVLGHVVENHFESIVSVILITSDLTRQDLETDGDGAITIQDLWRVLQAAAEVNELDRVLESLGNVPTPPATVAKKTDLTTTSKPSFSINSQKTTGGLGAGPTV